MNAAQQDIDVDLGRLFASLLRNWRRIAVVALAVTGLAYALATLATPQYMAETRILIESRESIFTRPNVDSDADRPLLDEEGITSQVQVIASTDLLKQVAGDLKLAERSEFDASGQLSSLGRVLVLLGLKSDPGEIPADERVLKTFREKLSVYRVERSRVIVIEFSSEDPELAAAVPNAIAAAYLAVQRDAKQQSNADATRWLEPEIAQLTERVREAESKVAQFRGESDLLVGQGTSVLATQQLSELSTELSRVRASRASAEATAESVRTALRDGASPEAFPSVLSSGLIQRLRERQVQLKADIADLSATLLDNHPRIKSLKSQLSDLDLQIRNEAEKVLDGLDAEAKAAGFRERQLVADLNRLKAESARAGEDEVELRALEREAASQRQLLESYLARYREAASRGDGNYLPVDARVFSSAIAPAEPYFPKKIPIAAAAFAGSLLIMAIVTLLQELFSGRAMRPASGARVAPIERVEMAPVAPRAETPAAPAPKPVRRDTEPAPVVKAAPAAAHDALAAEAAIERLISSGSTRAIFISPEGDEAAASAVLVARGVADAGLRVLLLDLTLSGAASTAMLETDKMAGITDLLASEAQFRDVIHADLYSDCHVIPSGNANPARAMRAAERLPIILTSLAAAYDMIVIECGPAEPASIARLTGDGAEMFVSVVDAEQSEADTALVGLTEIAGVMPTLVTPGDAADPRSPQAGSRNVA